MAAQRAEGVKMRTDVHRGSFKDDTLELTSDVDPSSVQDMTIPLE